MLNHLFKNFFAVSVSVVAQLQPQSHIIGIEIETLNPKQQRSNTDFFLWIKGSFTAFLKMLF
jgi:hypothetical protein